MNTQNIAVRKANDAIRIDIYEPNTKGRDFIIGDLHGAYELLDKGLGHVKFDPSSDRLFSVGDLVDRGPQSDLCLGLIKQDWFHAVMANHEDMMVRAMIDQDRVWSRIWAHNGGHWIEEFYHGHQQHRRQEIEDLALAASNLPHLIVVKDSFNVIHAEFYSQDQYLQDELEDLDAVEPAITMQTGDGSCGIWGRYFFGPLYSSRDIDLRAEQNRFRTARKGSPKIQNLMNTMFSGHTPVYQPTQVGKFINIDTGAYNSLDRKFGDGKISGKDYGGLTIVNWTDKQYILSRQEGVKLQEKVVVVE